MRQPVIEYAFDTPFRTIVRSYRSGQAFRMLLKGSLAHRMCSYMSSVAIRTCGCLRNTTPRDSNSFFVYATPVGFDGLLITNRRVLGVIAFSNCSALILKLCSMPA